MSGQILAALLVMGLVTLALRAAPFVALATVADSAFMRHLGTAMPAGVMVVLVIYTLRDTPAEAAAWGPALAALSVTIGLHLWLRRSAASVLVGTVTYMALLALVG